MSFTTTTISYNFNLTLHPSDNSGDQAAYPVFTNACGMTDELAIAFARAFLAMPLPAGVTARAWITRHETGDLQSEADLTAGVFA